MLEALLALALLAPLAARPSDEAVKSPAQLLLEEAESAAARGQYKKALALYRKLGEEYPQERAGEIGRRRSGENGYLGWAWLLQHGPPENRLDVVVMGEGFRLDQQGDFDTLAKMAPREFPRVEVFEEYFEYLNFLRVNLRSEDDGVDFRDRDYSTALDAAASGGIQSQVQVNRDAVRRMLAELPFHDGHAIVLVKNGVLGTGGQGVAAVGGRDPKTMVHEFGHSFGGLMDEYSSNTGHRGQVREGPNVARVEDPKRVPWAHWLEARVSGVGVYEGADGRPQGAWKPTTNCLMDVGQEFCEICREALILELHRFVDPIDEVSPAERREPADAFRLSSKTPLRDQQPIEFRVRTMRPKSHSLWARWYVLKEEDAPTPTPTREAAPDRAQRGRLNPIAAKPSKDTKAVGGADTFTFEQRDYGPGAWRVVLRVEDSTRVPKDRDPWVLKDPNMLLHSERHWRIVIE